MFKSNKITKITLSFIALAVIGGFGYQHFNKEVPIDYITTTTSIGTIEDTVLATGIIHPFQKVEVGSQASGQIRKIHVSLNQQVKAGDILVEIRSEIQKDQLRDAQSTLDNYKAQLISKKINLEKAELRFKRQSDLLSADATSQEDVDDSRINLEQAKADIIEINTKIKQSENALNTAATNLEYTTIRAPIDGVVVSIPVSVGQTINASQATPTVVQIAHVDTVTIKPEIAEADIIKVKIGMPIYFNILGDTDQIYKSVLKSIDIGPTTLSDQGKTTATTTSSNSGIYYYGSFDYPNVDKKFRMSMSAQVSIVVGKSEDVVILSADAIRQKNGEKFVTVLENGRKIDKKIKTGLTNNITTEIKEGLKEGEEVILTEGKASNNIRGPRMM